MKLTPRQEEIVKLVKEGEPVTSETLATKLGVTRAALRPDLAILTMIGILDARPKVGYVYCEGNKTNILYEEIMNSKVLDIMSKPITVNVYCSYTLSRTGLSVKMPDNTEEYALVKASAYASYKFSGWNSKTDGTGTAYSANTSYTFYDSTTLYVRWFRPVYKNTTTNKTYDILNYAKPEAMLATSSDWNVPL